MELNKFDSLVKLERVVFTKIFTSEPHCVCCGHLRGSGVV